MTKTITSFFLLILTLCLLLILSLPGRAAQLGHHKGSIALISSQSKLARLAPDTLSGESVFFLDESNTVYVGIISPIDMLNTQIRTPNGDILSPESSQNFGGEFIAFGTDLATMPPSTRFNYIYRFPFADVGEYSVEFEAPTDLSQSIPVSAQVITDSPLRANLLAVQNRLVEGNSIILTVFIFEGNTPALNAEVKAIVRSDALQQPIELSLHDDGNEVDKLANDGLYSIRYTPPAVGEYQALAEISGQRTTGSPYFRQAGAVFNVFEKTARLTEILGDMGIDDNSDGLFEKIAVDVGIDVLKAGDYRAFIYMQTSSGKILVNSNGGTLNVGHAQIPVEFDAKSLLNTGEDGPYTIKKVTLLYYGEQSAIEVDRLFNAEETQAYLLSQFYKPALALTRIISSRGIDTNGDDHFDILQASLEFDAIQGGSYSWTINLSTLDVEKITYASGQSYFTPGLNSLTVNFDGTAVGNLGIDGSYLLTGLAVTGPASLLKLEVGEIGPFSAGKFSGTYQIEGNIYDQSGKPLANAAITLNDDKMTTTDQNGYYTFRGLGAGTYVITVSKDGYTKWSTEVTLNKQTPEATVVASVQSLGRPAIIVGIQGCNNNSAVVNSNRILIMDTVGIQQSEFATALTGKGINLASVDYDFDGSMDVAVSGTGKADNIFIYDAKGTQLTTLTFSDGNTGGIQSVFAHFGGAGLYKLLIARQSADNFVYYSDGNSLQPLKLLDKAVEFKLTTNNVTDDNEGNIIISLIQETSGENLHIFDITGTHLNSLIALVDEHRKSNTKAPGIVVTTADINADGISELIVGQAEKNQGYGIAVYTMNGIEISRFDAFPSTKGTPPELAGCSNYAGRGVILSSGDIDGDGRAEVIAAQRGGREIRVFDATYGTLVNNFIGTDESYVISDIIYGANVNP